jgi:hypothetical protein
MRVLIATDFSPHAEDAVKIVKGLPLPSGSTVRVLNAIEPFADVATLNPGAITAFTDAAVAQTKSELERIAARLRAPGREVETVTVLGRVADAMGVQYEREGKSNDDRQSLLAAGAGPDGAQVGIGGEAGERDRDGRDEDRHDRHATARGARGSRERARTRVGTGLTLSGTFVTPQPP